MANLLSSLGPLTARPQWVAMKREVRGGKVTKPPIDPNKAFDRRYPSKASVVDPSTWSSHAAAEHFNATYGLDGIGYVFTEEDPFFGLDLDNVLNPTTGELTPWALWLVEQCATYTEISQSGSGLHIIGIGDPPANHKNRNRYAGATIELYTQRRFFHITGNVYQPG